MKEFLVVGVFLFAICILLYSSWEATHISDKR